MNRRQFMGGIVGTLAAASLGARNRAFADPAPTGGMPPNIVIILADDMGYSDLGCYGSEISTPSIDSLADGGIRFTQAYNAARCCPSRAALLTGLYPHQAGMGDMVGTVKKPRKPGPYQGYLNGQCVTIAEMLRTAGYGTYMSGKWHVGEKPEHWPRKRGFDRYFGLISGASSYYEILQQEESPRKMALDDEPFTPEGDNFYMTDAFTDHAVRFLEGHDTAKPFFLYLAYTAPHWPLHAPKEEVEKYRGKYTLGWEALRERRYRRMVDMGIINPKWRLSPRDADVPPWDGMENKDEWDLRMAVYAAMITRMDRGVGRVLDTLRAMGAEENTLVLFLADNGGCHERIKKDNLITPGAVIGDRGSYTSYDRNWANASNTPFRMFKHWCHEGGIATPLIARWPARIRQKGALVQEPAHITDIMPTCLEMAGVKYPETFSGNTLTPLPGVSLEPLFEGRGAAPRAGLFWEHEGNRAVRMGKWKLVAPKDGPWELYDLEEDRTELNNMAASMPEKAGELNRAWEKWAAEIGVELAGKPAKEKRGG